MRRSGILLRLAGVCAALGITLSVAGFCLGGRLTNIRVYWGSGGPRVEYDEHPAYIWDLAASEQEPVTTNTLEELDILDGSNGAVSEQVPSDFIPNETTYITQGTADYNIPEGDIRKLSIECAGIGGSGDDMVIILAGESWSIVSDSNCLFTSEVDEDDGEWKITAKRKSKMYSAGELTITVPYDVILEELDLEVSAGMVHIEGIECHESEISVGAGTVWMQNFTCLNESDWEVGAGDFSLEDSQLLGTVEIQCGMGSVYMLLNRPGSLGYEVESAMGSVTIGDAVFSGVAVAKSSGLGPKEADLYFDIECGMGTVDIQFTD